MHQDEQAIIERLSKSTITEQATAEKRAIQEKKRAEKRLHELDNLLAKIYEDRLNEKINERNFSILSQKCQREQDELEAKIETLTAQLASTKEQEDGINKWIDLIKQFSSPTELTADMLNTLIEKILATLSYEDRARYEQQLIDWYEQAANGQDEETREAAIIILVNKHLACEKIEEAQKLIALLPDKKAVDKKCSK